MSVWHVQVVPEKRGRKRDGATLVEVAPVAAVPAAVVPVVEVLVVEGLGVVVPVRRKISDFLVKK
ncbi:hypothetical protein [Thermoflavimicrobium dichotomicum]|uniref:hypothetical protein n=1 Tax=Thermoflavimicrobium dichotomicum TaxID=46223 RepID=UPI000B808CE1|nr:hypothetical protein [Thermoflavimicrobium dichotomicum]